MSLNTHSPTVTASIVPAQPRSSFSSAPKQAGIAKSALRHCRWRTAAGALSLAKWDRLSSRVRWALKRCHSHSPRSEPLHQGRQASKQNTASQQKAGFIQASAVLLSQHLTRGADSWDCEIGQLSAHHHRPRDSQQNVVQLARRLAACGRNCAALGRIRAVLYPTVSVGECRCQPSLLLLL